jgi:FkbH-like protein
VEISNELNINIDSLVFIDDSQFEIEQIRHQLPQVTTIWLDPKMRTNYANYLKALACFDTWQQTEEDKLRGKMYQSQRERQVFQQQRSLLDYLTGLNMRLRVNIACEKDIPRVAQQTQRTNQFNLTTKRYSEGQIRQFIESSDYVILTASLEDRFGSMGLVGTAIIQIKSENQADIDTFLLSCRAIGRKVEYSFLNQIIKTIHAMGINKLFSSRIPNEKNAQTSDFYLNSGFIQMPSMDVSSQKFVCLDLEKDIAPQYISIIEEDK